MTSLNRNIRLRFRYVLLIVFVIVLGILSRKASFIPLIIGDVLYAAMMFLCVKLLFIRVNFWIIALISLLICFLIELSQLYNAVWINDIRNTTLGALILGRGFLWSDIVAYTIGTIICILFFQFTRIFSDKVD
ncbi:DUF2809 domain-containing protein [Pedobacter heparinus]|uniref:DUF2809 domain-containing protein n=1 Tax=Pedobacter heparinus (strain ATCC 13125 / DSM 2366 / CIP 104194 / JCM 7457 / NBRC 12017 / NCIMB 9290 / NRRL B-14731 / HIM 762-3) TaxID=485917 RepID=C6XYV4_PEDHD|nr:DUF2809 domain-containing protein [Pedobacter heparinus]ACU04586.1 conserved hypothetical protein [Pedobacter heparinus DSM 2366]